MSTETYGNKNTEALINGKKMHYDACTDCSLQEAKKIYSRFDYIGSGNVIYIDDIENKMANEYHFFVKKPVIKTIEMSTETQRTPGEWKPERDTSFEGAGFSYFINRVDGSIYRIALVYGSNVLEAEANAKYICTAVNNHQTLLTALKDAQHYLGYAINAIATGEMRNVLCDANIRALSVIAAIEQK